MGGGGPSSRIMSSFPAPHKPLASGDAGVLQARSRAPRHLGGSGWRSAATALSARPGCRLPCISLLSWSSCFRISSTDRKGMISLQQIYQRAKGSVSARSLQAGPGASPAPCLIGTDAVAAAEEDEPALAFFGRRLPFLFHRTDQGRHNAPFQQARGRKGGASNAYFRWLPSSSSSSLSRSPAPACQKNRRRPHSRPKFPSKSHPFPIAQQGKKTTPALGCWSPGSGSDATAARWLG